MFLFTNKQPYVLCMLSVIIRKIYFLFITDNKNQHFDRRQILACLIVISK